MHSESSVNLLLLNNVITLLANKYEESVVGIQWGIFNYTPIHRFKLSDWLKEGHMTCVLVFTIFLTLEESVKADEFGTFMVRYGLKKSFILFYALLFGEW